jgi:hypothetical protein
MLRDAAMRISRRVTSGSGRRRTVDVHGWQEDTALPSASEHPKIGGMDTSAVPRGFRQAMSCFKAHERAICPFSQSGKVAGMTQKYGSEVFDAISHYSICENALLSDHIIRIYVLFYQQ